MQGLTAEQALGEPRQPWLTRGAPQDVCRKIGSWHESLGKRPPKLPQRIAWLASLEALRAGQTMPAEASEPLSKMSRTLTSLNRPGTPALRAEAMQEAPQPVLPSCTPSAPSKRPKCTRREVMSKSAATAYGGPVKIAAPGPKLVKPVISAAEEIGQRIIHRAEERDEVEKQREGLEKAIPVKAAGYHRTPAKTAGVLSKLLARVNPRGVRGGPQKDMTFQSW